MWRNFLLLRKGGVFSVYTTLGFMEIVSFRYIKYLDGIHLHPGPPGAPLAYLFLPAAKSSCCFPDLFHLLFSFLVIKFLPSKPNARFKHENCTRNQKSLLLKARRNPQLWDGDVQLSSRELMQNQKTLSWRPGNTKVKQMEKQHCF